MVRNVSHFMAAPLLSLRLLSSVDQKVYTKFTSKCSFALVNKVIRVCQTSLLDKFTEQFYLTILSGILAMFPYAFTWQTSSPNSYLATREKYRL